MPRVYLGHHGHSRRCLVPLRRQCIGIFTRKGCKQGEEIGGVNGYPTRCHRLLPEGVSLGLYLVECVRSLHWPMAFVLAVVRCLILHLYTAFMSTIQHIGSRGGSRTHTELRTLSGRMALALPLSYPRIFPRAKDAGGVRD